ncbi:hypothetical protein [uncultured Maribacter sp.]|uniref:hypothetical protein n=1 Tax=uncultured Maribacter sp. TaxID=431308 RepID=UPI00260676F2|nr:hypothetical protein [uncultured Maribacter sp.]
MKPYKLLILTILFSTFFIGCKEAKKENVTTNSEKSTLHIEQDKPDIYFEKNASCSSFINAIDFSSLCFSTNKTPDYDLKSPETANICKYNISTSENSKNISITLTFFDYNSGGFNGRQKPQQVRELIENSFDKRKKNTQLFASYKDASLGDKAFFTFNEAKTNKALHFRIGNVQAFIEILNNNENPCYSSDAELLKLGKLILNNLKK